MVSKYLPAVILGLLLSVSVRAQTFQAEEDFKDRAKLPAGILKILAKNERVGEL